MAYYNQSESSLLQERGSAPSALGMQPQRVGELTASVDAIASEIDALGKEVDRLNAQLSPVLNHSEKAESSPGESKAGRRCEMGAALHVQVERVRQLAGVVRSMSMRLEV